MATRLHSDRLLFLLTLGLVVFGLVMVFSASAVLSADQFGTAYIFLLRQTAWAVAGLLVMLVAMRIDYRHYRHAAVVFPALSLALALLVLVLFFDRLHNTHRWFRFGLISFQPSEFSKPVLALFLAWFLERRAGSVNDFWRTIVPAVVVVTAVAGLIVKEPDLGTGFTLVFVACAMFFLAGVRLRYFAAPLLAAIPAFYLLVMRVPYRWKRIEAFLDPYADPMGKGFHMIQSLIAVGTGGVTGLGLMEGRQKLFYLPEPHTDFIFAVVAEELGLIGALVLVFTFGLIFWRGFRAAYYAPDLFGRYLAGGLTTMIVGQALINISVVVGLMPTKGIPLPFISAGGSSLLFNLLAMGLLLNVSQHARE
jgi:cell division protein FtsW